MPTAPRAASRRASSGSPDAVEGLRSNATSKGLLGSSRGWRIVFGLIMAKRFWGKIMGKEPQVVAVDKLKPGQFMTIEAIGPKDKRRR